MIFRISHGYQVQSDHDPFVKLAEDALAVFSKTSTHGAFLVDILPFRKSYLHGTWTMLNAKCCIVQHIPEWVPGAGFKVSGKHNF